MKEAFLTLDTGGSKSHVMLTDLCGDTIAESYFAGCGLSSDSDIELLPQLKREIDKMRSAEGIASLTVKRAVVNLGGKNKNQIQRTLAACLPGTPIDIFRESEGVLAQEMGKAYGANAVLLAGTGFIAIAWGPDRRFVADGWGREIGDAGSGYDIGIRAIRRSLQALEEEGPLPLIAQRITGRSMPLRAEEPMDTQMKIRDAVRANFMPLQRERVAALTKTVSECAACGDEAAKEIFQAAGRAMAKTVLRALSKADCGEARILIAGGLTNCSAYWKEEFEKAVHASKVMITQKDLTFAAIQWARERG